MRKKSDKAKLKLKCDVLWAQIVKRKGVCEMCGKPATAAHHAMGRTRIFLRHALCNGVALCYSCHQRLHTHEAHTFWEWFEKTRPDDYHFVIKHKNTICKNQDYEAVFRRLTAMKELLDAGKDVEEII